MADEKGKVTEKNQEPKPRSPEALPDELTEKEFDKVSGGGVTGPLRDQY